MSIQEVKPNRFPPLLFEVCSTMKIKDYGLTLCAMSLLLFCAIAVSGQETRSTISGTVSDPGGAAVPAATVTATEVRTGVQAPTYLSFLRVNTKSQPSLSASGHSYVGGSRSRPARIP
jgi:hypothetical protein